MRLLFGNVVAVDGGIGEISIAIIPIIDINICPFSCRTSVIHVGKAITTLKCTFANRSNANRNYNDGEAIAIRERIITNKKDKNTPLVFSSHLRPENAVGIGQICPIPTKSNTILAQTKFFQLFSHLLLTFSFLFIFLVFLHFF